jgi:hypothetical protein
VALEETGARGLIQGDSFSPLLFVFVMEAMGRVLSTVINRGGWMVSQWAVLLFLIFCLLMML